mmetsp:Transcript_12672/g.14107  ORF Transcript_12672/g.14107 Transcript_12672/m.14107 type:complete len:80 (+) Transcript_12672:818-1057(+)
MRTNPKNGAHTLNSHIMSPTGAALTQELHNSATIQKIGFVCSYQVTTPINSSNDPTRIITRNSFVDATITALFLFLIKK